MTSSILDSSWTLVEEFDPFEEYDKEEIAYLTLDFGAGIDSTKIANLTDIQLLGLNSTNPFAQLGPIVYQGIHERLIGSEIICAQDEKSYTPFTISSDRIIFTPIVLTTHEESAAQEAKDQKTLNKKLTKGSGNPRTKKKVAPVGKAVEKQKSGDVEEAEVEVEEMEVDQEVEEDMNMEASGSNSNVAEGSGD